MLNWNNQPSRITANSLNGAGFIQGPIIDVTISSRLWNTGVAFRRGLQRAHLGGVLTQVRSARDHSTDILDIQQLFKSISTVSEHAERGFHAAAGVCDGTSAV